MTGCASAHVSVHLIGKDGRMGGKEVGTLSLRSLDTVQIPSSERGGEREILTRGGTNGEVRRE